MTDFVWGGVQNINNKNNLCYIFNIIYALIILYLLVICVIMEIEERPSLEEAMTAIKESILEDLAESVIAYNMEKNSFISDSLIE